MTKKYAPKNPEGPVSEGQTWGLFKIARRDYREDVNSRQINAGQFAEVVNNAYQFAAAHNWDRAATQTEVERLLANFPAK